MHQLWVVLSVLFMQAASGPGASAQEVASAGAAAERQLQDTPAVDVPDGFVIGPVIAALFISAWDLFSTSVQEEADIT